MNIELLIIIGHDSLPIQRLSFVKRSLVFRSNEHDKPMPNITNKNRPTHSPDSAWVVMLTNTFEPTALDVSESWRILGADEATLR